MADSLPGLDTLAHICVTGCHLFSNSKTRKSSYEVMTSSYKSDLCYVPVDQICFPAVFVFGKTWDLIGEAVLSLFSR